MYNNDQSESTSLLLNASVRFRRNFYITGKLFKRDSAGEMLDKI